MASALTFDSRSPASSSDASGRPRTTPRILWISLAARGRRDAGRFLGRQLARARVAEVRGVRSLDANPLVAGLAALQGAPAADHGRDPHAPNARRSASRPGRPAARIAAWTAGDVVGARDARSRVAASGSSTRYDASGSPSRGWPTLPGLTSARPAAEAEVCPPLAGSTICRRSSGQEAERHRDVGVAVQADVGLEHGQVLEGDRRRSRRTRGSGRAGCRGRGVIRSMVWRSGRADSQARVVAVDRVAGPFRGRARLRVEPLDLAARPAPRRRGCRARRPHRPRSAERRRRPDPGRSRRRRRAARRRRPYRRGRGPHRAPRGCCGCPRGPRRASRQSVAASGSHDGPRRSSPRTAAAGGRIARVGDRAHRRSACRDHQAVARAGPRRSTSCTSSVPPPSASTRPPGRRELGIEVAALPGDEDAARLEQRERELDEVRGRGDRASRHDRPRAPRWVRLRGERLGPRRDDRPRGRSSPVASTTVREEAAFLPIGSTRVDAPRRAARPRWAGPGTRRPTRGPGSDPRPASRSHGHRRQAVEDVRGRDGAPAPGWP